MIFSIGNSTQAGAGPMPWCAGEPNNFGGDEQCLAINLCAGGLNDENCGASFPYICEHLGIFRNCIFSNFNWILYVVYHTSLLHFISVAFKSIFLTQLGYTLFFLIFILIVKFIENQELIIGL